MTTSPDASSPTPLIIVYRIDENDRLCEVNDAWRHFALENGGGDALAAGLIGSPSWPCITDCSARELYRRLTARARAGQPVRFRYRCDAPAFRRTFAMTIEARPGGEVEFSSELLISEPRPLVPLLDHRSARSSALIRVCGWCQLVGVGPEEWVPVEEAVTRLGLLEAELLPALTHGICAACEDAMMKLIGEER